MRIVQLANFYGPRSGGLRTALHHLGEGYPDERLPSGVRRITLPAPKIPGAGGYRVVDPLRVKGLLRTLRPDLLEVSDRLTLRGMGTWGREHGVRTVVISHERLDRLLEQFLLPASLACTTAFAREEFDRIGAPNVRQVPLGVDLTTVVPARRNPALHTNLARGADALIVHCGRLSSEKRVERSIDALAELHETGNRTRPVIAGDGPRLPALRRRAKGLPLTFLGFLHSRADVAALLATADVSLAPGPHETFGLAALEALASGTPVVVSASGALKEIVRRDCGQAVGDHPAAFARAVTDLLDIPEPVRRAAARARAEQFDWSTSVRGMLAAHR